MTIRFICIFTLLIATSLSSKADSFIAPVGKTTDGWNVVVMGENGPPMLVILQKKGKHGKTQYMNYESEMCEFIYGESMELKCDRKNRSPLAGTHYKSRKFDDTCNIIMYCVSGCSKKSRAPKRLTRYGEDCAPQD